MFKASVAAIFWTIVLAVPFTVAALLGVAYLTEHTAQIAAFINTISQQMTIGERGWMATLAERLPELAGMIIGQLVLLTILLFARKTNQEQEV
jgi:hypothetical protein